MRRSYRFQEEMMRMTRGWTGLRAAAIAFGTVALLASHVRADAISSPSMTYNTAGSIGTTGVSGDGNVITYIPVTSGSFTSPSFLNLGFFQVAPLKDGQSTTYKDTPFSLTFLPSTVGGSDVTADVKPITITGKLTGTINGNSQSSVTALFDPISAPTFTTPGFKHNLSITNTSLSLVPALTGNGQTSIQANFVSTSNPEKPVPEPTTIALFLTTIGGIGLRKRVLAGRQRARD
jgi:hypothetical protein